MVTATKVWYAKNSNPPREVSPEVGRRQAAEWAVVSAFVRTALKAGHTIGVYDGEAMVVNYSNSYKTIMAAIMSTDDDQLIVYPVGATSGKRLGWVALTYGNDGPDVISDYTTNLEHLMGKANEVSERLYDKGNY